MECRSGCGACCIAWTISSPIPGMPAGKPAGVPCVQLDDQYRCKVFGKPERPKACGHFQPQYEICGDTRKQAMEIIAMLEISTQPDNK